MSQELIKVLVYCGTAIIITGIIGWVAQKIHYNNQNALLQATTVQRDVLRVLAGEPLDDDTTSSPRRVVNNGKARIPVPAPVAN